MLTRPRFKPHLRVQVVPGEGVFVLADSTQTLLKGRLYERVVPHVDGRPADDLCDQLEDTVTSAEVYYVLAQLERRGYLCEEDGSLTDEEAAFWSAQQVDPAVAVRRLAETPVTVRGFGVDPGPLSELLQAARVLVTGGEELGVVLTDGYLRAELDEYNAGALAAGRPWLLARPVGRQVWVGPLFRPGVTACWACLAQRLRANRPVETYLSGKNGAPGAAAERAASPASRAAALGLVATAVATWVARRELPALEGKVQTFDVASWQVRSHTLVRLPHCPACGSAGATGSFRPVALEGRAEVVTRDGGHRTVPPEVTLERYGHHVSPLTGAVTMLERVGPTADGAMHVYLAGTNLARRHHSLEHLRGDLRNMSSGKGVTDAQARASGLCEGLERYSGVFRGDEIRRLARLTELGDEAVHPNRCLLFSERQYREREERNAGHSLYGFIPVPFDPEAEVEWTPAWSLTRREPRYLPTAFCYFNYPHPGREPFCIADSNGNAAGNTLAEAILQGFFELAERDAVALWWYNRVRRPGVDLDAFDDPYPARLRDALRPTGRDLWAIDLTSDLGVPVFAALSRSATGPEEQIVLGFGAHLDPRVALLRALTEMNQMLAALLSQTGRGPSADAGDEETARWLRTATVANQPYLLANDAPPRTAADHPRAWTDDVVGDVHACQAIVERLGLEMLVLDQTRPEIGLPVAKVIVPGLRHFWARFAPGRLYDVPARLGWLPRPLTEDELNPIPMFL